MADESSVQKVCETPACNKPASLQCPSCIKLNIEGSFFCSQDCFKGYWIEHKKLHKAAKAAGQRIVNTGNSYIPWPDYRFTGKIRPWPKCGALKRCKLDIFEKERVGKDIFLSPGPVDPKMSELMKTPMRTVPPNIERPDYADTGNPISEMKSKQSTQIQVLSKEEIEGMRLVCKLAREVLDEGAKAIKIGTTGDEIDRIVHEASVERNCYPSPLNYHNFPKSCCTSVNEVICHGIPDKRPLEDGDIVNLDVTVYHGGFHGDLNETFFVGNVDSTSKQLVNVTHECLMQAIDLVKPGVRYREIGNVIQKHAQAHGFSVVRSYCGHGINQLFHTAPSVPHYAKNKAVGVMKPGHTFTIEPMISQGTWRDETWPDQWTAVTQDGKRSAQFEHTLLVTETGCDILTARLEEKGAPHFKLQM